MLEAAVSPLTAWANFYVIMGSAAATLTGLVFVVITLVARTRDRLSDDGIAAFSTPTVVHFCTALAVAAIFNAPWQVLWHAALPLGLSGLAGVAYIAVITRRMLLQKTYQPVREDWLWHVVFPLVSYIALALAALILPANPVPVLFVVGAATVLLLFIGIHNAWDTVTYIVVTRLPPHDENEN